MKISTAVTSVPLYRIDWTGSGFTFINGADVAVPQHGIATCVVPGPRCSLAIDVVTSVVWPHEGSNTNFMWGVSPRIAGAQVQVPELGERGCHDTCLFGTMNGRIYASGGQYSEYQMVIFGQY